MQHYLIAADRSGAGQRLRQGPDRVVPHGENDDARLGDPGGRLVFGTNGQLEGLRDRLLPAAVEADVVAPPLPRARERSEEHTSELQSHSDLVCRLLLEKKKKQHTQLIDTQRTNVD